MAIFDEDFSGVLKVQMPGDTPASLPPITPSSTTAPGSGFSWNGLLNTLATTATNIYNTKAQSDLLSQQINHGQLPSVTADKLGRPSGQNAPQLLGFNGAGVSLGGGNIIVIVLVLVGVVLLFKVLGK